MSRFSPLITLLFAAVMFLSFTPSSQARPVQVIIFPDSARVWEESTVQTLRHDDRITAEIILPPQADPATIRTALQEPAAVTDIAWERTDPLEAQQVVKLKDKLELLINKQTSLEIAIKSADKSAAFWENQAGFQAKEISAMKTLSETIAANLQQIFTSIENDRRQLEKNAIEINELKKKIEQISGPEQRMWKVTLSLAPSIDTETIDIAYNYILTGCGWKSFYRMDAVPDKQHIFFSWYAQIWQSSGMDWEDIEMTLATLEPQRQLNPRPIPDWIVGPRQDAMPKARLARTAGDFEMMESMAMMPESAPVLERTGTYSQWKLGRRSLAAGDRPRIKIQEQIWPVDFTHLLRPGIGNQAFIRAEVDFDEALDLPRGETMFLLDGAHVGKQQVRLASTSETIFFGHDPFVTSELTFKERKSGVRGVFTNRQTYLWNYTIHLKNNHLYPVKIRMEEPRPILRDQRIDASFKFNPEPDEQTDSLFVWHLTMEPGQDLDIQVQISMEAPKDMEVDWGWRR